MLIDKVDKCKFYLQMASLHLLRILDYWLSMRKYHMITWPFSSPKQLLVQLVTNIFMVEGLWKAEKPNNWIWLFLIVEVPPLIVNLLPSCYGLLLKITWVLTPKIASAIIWWSVTKYVAKLSKCTSIKALSNIWSTNSNHTSPLSKQYFFTFGWKLFSTGLLDDFHKVTKSVDLHDFRLLFCTSGGFLPSGLYAYEFLQDV